MDRNEVIARAIEQMNQPPQQRYSGPEAITRRDAVLQSRQLWPVPQTVISSTGGKYLLTEKDLGT